MAVQIELLCTTFYFDLFYILLVLRTDRHCRQRSCDSQGEGLILHEKKSLKVKIC